MSKVSIVLTVYNMESCLRETMDSVVGQTCRDLEIICIDDGSSDGSLAILQEYAAADERIKLTSRENKGQGASRNEGMNAATGDYVMLLDADDIYDTTMVEKLLARAEAVDADITVCRAAELNNANGKVRSILWTARAEWMPAHDPFSGRDMADYVFLGFIGWPWDKLYKRSFLVDNQLEFPPLANSEDLCFVFLSLARAQRISFVDEELILHRMGRAGSVSNSRKANSTAFYDAICLLKRQLQEDPAAWADFQWGFLNWAFDYTLWNIETMADVPTKEKMIAQLRDGAFPELELDKHGYAYFSLNPEVQDRYVAALNEIGDATDLEAAGLGRDKHPRLDMVIAFFREAKKRGYGKAFSKTFAKVFGQSSEDRMKNARSYRGTAYFPAAKKGQRND